MWPCRQVLYKGVAPAVKQRGILLMSAFSTVIISIPLTSLSCASGWRIAPLAHGVIIVLNGGGGAAVQQARHIEQSPSQTGLPSLICICMQLMGQSFSQRPQPVQASVTRSLLVPCEVLKFCKGI
jgi:hypothetical protein